MDYSVRPFSMADYEKGNQMEAKTYKCFHCKVDSTVSNDWTDVFCWHCKKTFLKKGNEIMKAVATTTPTAQAMVCPKYESPQPKFKAGDRVKILADAYTGIPDKDLDRSKVYTVGKNGFGLKEFEGKNYSFSHSWFVMAEEEPKVETPKNDTSKSKRQLVGFTAEAAARFPGNEKINSLVGKAVEYEVKGFDGKKHIYIFYYGKDVIQGCSTLVRNLLVPVEWFSNATAGGNQYDSELGKTKFLGEPILVVGGYSYEVLKRLGYVGAYKKVEEPKKIEVKVEEPKKLVGFTQEVEEPKKPNLKLVGFTQEAYEKFREPSFTVDHPLKAIIGYAVECESDESVDASVRWHKFYHKGIVIVRYDMATDVSKVLPPVKWVSNELKFLPGQFVGDIVGASKDNYDALKKSGFMGIYEPIKPEDDPKTYTFDSEFTKAVMAEPDKMLSVKPTLEIPQFDKLVCDPIMEALRDRTVKVDVPLLTEACPEPKEKIKVDVMTKEMIDKKPERKLAIYTADFSRLFNQNPGCQGEGGNEYVGKIVEYEKNIRNSFEYEYRFFYQDKCWHKITSAKLDDNKVLPPVEYDSNFSPANLADRPAWLNEGGYIIGEPIPVSFAGGTSYEELKKRGYVGVYKKITTDPVKELPKIIPTETEKFPKYAYNKTGYTAQSETYFGKANNPYSLIGRVVEYTWFEKDGDNERHQVWLGTMLMHERDMFKTSHDYAMKNNGLVPVEWLYNIYESDAIAQKERGDLTSHYFIGKPVGTTSTTIAKLEEMKYVGVYKRIDAPKKDQDFMHYMRESAMKEIMAKEDKRFLEAITYYPVPMAEWTGSMGNPQKPPESYWQDSNWQYKDRKQVVSDKVLELCKKFAGGDFDNLRRFNAVCVDSYEGFTLDEIREALVIISSSYLDKHGEQK
jgi:hypothetical protein